MRSRIANVKSQRQADTNQKEEPANHIGKNEKQDKERFRVYVPSWVQEGGLQADYRHC
jgi:hypothetical protein